jgi:hypothetical protein
MSAMSANGTSRYFAATQQSLLLSERSGHRAAFYECTAFAIGPMKSSPRRRRGRAEAPCEAARAAGAVYVLTALPSSGPVASRQSASAFAGKQLGNAGIFGEPADAVCEHRNALLRLSMLPGPPRRRGTVYASYARLRLLGDGQQATFLVLNFRPTLPRSIDPAGSRCLVPKVAGLLSLHLGLNVGVRNSSLRTPP